VLISSRTPEGRPNRCSLCGSDIQIEPSDPPGDAPCPRCGQLLWFARENIGDVQIVKPAGSRLDLEELERLIESIETRPSMRLLIDFSHVRQMTSAVLGKLINLKRRLNPAKGRLTLRVHPDLVEVFRVTRLDELFDLES
jgi:anti-anti-sigma regulatory factor